MFMQGIGKVASCETQGIPLVRVACKKLGICELLGLHGDNQGIPKRICEARHSM